jgi:hypothetical protein
MLHIAPVIFAEGVSQVPPFISGDITCQQIIVLLQFSFYSLISRKVQNSFILLNSVVLIRGFLHVPLPSVWLTITYKGLYTGLFEMIVGVLTICHTQYT